MKNYNAYESGWFDTTEEEINKLKMKGTVNIETYDKNLSKIKNIFYSGFSRNGGRVDIVAYSLRHVPEKRNNWDSAVLLCVRLANGEYAAKRHNNSQWVSLDYNS